jgi:acyl carrier protein
MMDAELARRITEREAVLTEIKRILIDRLHVRRPPEQIDPDTPLFGTGLRLDSLDAVELWVHVTGVFGVELPEEPLRRITSTRTLGTLADLILERRR